MKLLRNMWSMTSGKKAFLAGGALMVFAILGMALGKLTPQEAMQMFLNGLGIVGVRDAIKNII